MRIAGALVVCLAAVGCSGGDPSSPSTPPSVAPSSPTVVEPVGPSPSGEGFCTDQVLVGDVYRLVREGTVPYREAAAAVTAVGKVVRTNISLADSDVGARKLQQLALYLNTLRLAILGAAENYPGDYAVRQFSGGLPNRIQDVSDELGCVD